MPGNDVWMIGNFHRIMELMQEYLNGKRHRYAMKLRVSLDDENVGESEWENTGGSECAGGDSADSS